jgi:hypothetical protein
VYFAHRCFWFIRSWYLPTWQRDEDIPWSPTTSTTSTMTLPTTTTTTTSTTTTLTTQGDPNNNNTTTSHKNLVEGRTATTGTSTSSLSTLLDGWGKKSTSDVHPQSNVTDEERQLMLSLLDKIMVCWIYRY